MDDGTWRLRLDGAVQTPIDITLHELRSLPQSEVCAPFRCSEGWTIPAVRWRGVRAGLLLSRAQCSADARFAVAAAGGYTALLPIGDLDAPGALIALERDGRPLDPAIEGPARLVVTGSACLVNVKSLQRLTLTTEIVPTTAEGAAQSRSASDLFREAVRLAHRDAPLDQVLETDLQQMWDDLEARLPSAERTGSYTAVAEMLTHLLQSRLGARLPKGRRYREQLQPLARELHALLGLTDSGERSETWFAFVARCAAVYTERAVPYRYRLLAQQWSKMAAGSAFAESGRVIVPPTLDGKPETPFWLEG